MDEQALSRRRSVRGTLRSRLLINSLVDAEEVTSHLPPGVRPHLVDGRTVVGCCLLDIANARPGPLPAIVGVHLRAVAHRFSVEWDDEFGAPQIGVFVPTRHTDSHAAVLAGGRLFPGVHRRALVSTVDDGRHLEWLVEPTDQAEHYSVSVAVSIEAASRQMQCEPIGAICVGAAIGLSPDPAGTLEAARMTPNHQRVHRVHVEDLRSGFLAGFTTAVPAPSYLMRDVDVVWTSERPPAT